MKKWIEKIKNKSEIEKQIFAFWSAVLITFFIFLVWLMATIYSFQNLDQKNNSKESSPFKSITNIISNTFNKNI